MLIDSKSTNFKEFPKPETGVYDAVIADVIDIGEKEVVYEGKTKMQRKARIIWLTTALDPEGNNFQLMQQVSVSMFPGGGKRNSKPSKLYEISKTVLGTTPPDPFDTESLIGKTGQVVVAREKSQDGKTEYANIKAVLPGKVAFPVPASFKRASGSAAPASAQSSTQASAPAPAAAVEDEDIPF